MTDSFEDHCWKDVISADVLDIYSQYRRELRIGPKPALLAVDLYELVYQGGPLPVAEVSKTYPMSCGEHAWAAIAPTRRLFSAAREAGIPVVYSTSETRADSRPVPVYATKRPRGPVAPELFDIRPEFRPQPGDLVIRKLRASAFFGTPLSTHLTQLGVQTLIVCGESTSGCVRATVVEGFSHGFQVVLVEECCFDRSELSHKVNLFDMHHKYADVMGVDAVIAHLRATK